MKRLTLSVFTFLVFSCSLLLEQIVIACGGGEDPYDYYYSFFHNNTAGSPAYMPFYFVTGYAYYDDWNSPSTPVPDQDLNLKEWTTFGKNRFSAVDAASFIYRYSYAQLSNLYYHIEQGKPLQLPDSIQRNGMTKWFIEDKDLEALGYLMFAKKCETSAVAASNWETPARDAKTMGNSVKSGLQLLKAAKKDFFQWRYTYQVLRMAFYSGDYPRTAALYKELVGDKTADNIMYYRCLSLNAGASYKTGDYNTAAYMYSRAFDGTDDNKLSNYVSYDWCFRSHGEDENGPTANRQAVTALAKNNKEKAVLALMDALHTYEDGLLLMKAAYDADPSVQGLEVAMTREVNKLELNLLDPQLRNGSGFNNSYYPYEGGYGYRTADNEETRTAKQQYNQQLKALIAFGSRLSQENKTAHAAFWPLSVAYLYFIQQDWNNCREWIGKATALRPEGRLKDMLHIEQLLLAINEKQRLDAATEAAILPSLEWLGERAQQDTKFAVTYRNLMTSVLPNVYMKQQDTLKALLCIAKGTTGADGKGSYSLWYQDEERKPVFVEPGYSVEMEQVSTARILELKSWMKTGKKTPYETFLVKYPPYQQGALDMYIGTRYLRQMDFDKAVALFKEVPRKTLEAYAFQDPFAERWEDTQEPADTVKVSDKYTFAVAMQALQSGLERADAQQLYRYANGLYSMTYYGLSWKAVMYYRSGSDALAYYQDENRKKLLPEYRNYYSAEAAARYYQLAFDRTEDKELKAKCLFMRSKCWQKNASIPNKTLYDPSGSDDYFLYTINSPYFKQLENGFAGTQAYKARMEDCSYLRYYVRRINKK